MAGSIKGITIEFRGDTTKLDKALREINNNTKSLDKELKQIDKALKFNPSSVDLWRQKQQLLTQKITDTEDKLKLLKDEQARMDAAGVDKNSEEYRKLQREIIETESKLKTFKKQLAQIGNVKLKALGEQFKQVGKKMSDMGKQLSMKVTAPLAAVGTVAVNKFAEVDKIMQLTNSTMDNGVDEAQLLNQAMKEAAANSTYGMNDAAQATLNFARAGLDAKEAAAALSPAMALAAGEGGELDTVSAGLVATINGFHGSFDEASQYADVFANACNNSALDVNSLSTAMSVAAPIFSSAGYSVNDAALYMGVMANNGIAANKAANSLKTGLARLVSPAKQGADMMADLGLYTDDGRSAFENLDGSMKDSVEVQKILHDSFSKLSESEQIAAASAIFGKSQMAPWLALINTAPGEVDKLSLALEKDGTALEMQGAMMSGFGGSIEQLKSGLDVLATSIGEALAPMIQKVVGAIQSLVTWFNSLSPETQRVIATIGLLAAAIGPVLVILGVLASSIGSIISLVGTIAPLLGGVGTAVGGLASGALLPIIAIAAGVIAIGVALYKNWDTIKAKAKALWNALKSTFNSIKTTIITTWNNIKNAINNTVNNIKSKVISTFNSVKATVASIWNGIKSAIVTPIQTAVDIVRSAIERIKSIINGARLSLPKIKLPHFSISGKFSLNPPSIPKISVDWYKTGGIFDSPSLIGVGEAGPEAVVPLDKFWDKLDKMQGGETNIVININGSTKDPREIAEEVKRVLIRETNNRRLAWQ